MSDRKRILICSILVMAGGMFCTAAVILTILHKLEIEEQRTHLMEIAKGQALFMEAVARFDAIHDQSGHPGGAREATLSQIIAAHEHYSGFGETGELVVAQREGDQIVFLFPHRHGEGSAPDPIPWRSELAEPMRLALSGQEGTLIGFDYRGEPVLAAYHPVAVLNLGVVAKSDMEEVRAPFVMAALIATGITFLLVLVGVGVTLRITDPLVRHLQQSEERLRLTLDAVSDGGWDWNVATGEVRYSDRWLESLGYKRDDVPPHASFWRSIVHPDDRPHCKAALVAHFDGRTPGFEYENRLRTASGKYRWNLARGRVVARDGVGKPLRMVGTDTDITKRKQAEQALRQLTKESRAIVDTAAEGIVTIDQHGIIQSFNLAAERIFGHTAEEAIGKNVKLLIPSPDKEQHDERIARYLLAGETTIIGSGREVDAQRKDGSIFPIHLAISEVRLDDRRMFVGIIRDITRPREAGEELRQAKEEAEAANQELKATNAQLEHAIERANQMAVQAEFANITKSQFLANMSHEIRTPMTAILGYADVLSDGLTDPVSIDAVQTIKRNGQHLLELINDILDLSKVESGKMTVENQRCDLMQLIGDTAASLRPKAEAKHIHLDVKYAGAIPRTICTDPTRLRQALMNLVGNAIKFTSQGGVTIRVGLLGNKSDPELLIKVVDTGIGIPPDSLNAIFEPFQQADSSTTRKFGGTGLGLTISKRIAELLGGGLEVQSEVGKGSVFALRITTGSLDGVEMIDQPLDEAGSRYEAEKQRATEQLDCRILLVEDGPDNQRLIAFVLKKAGAEVEVADNGKIGADLTLAAASAGRPFDVILMDMQMPVMDGYEATEFLRQKDYPGPIIALTAHAMGGDRQKCLDAGCDDYATKPIDRKKLIAAIQKHLTGKAAVAELHGSEIRHG